MDTFVLLPFFLLSRVPTDVDTWRYGPEYTHAVDVNITRLSDSPPIKTRTLHVQTTLKCRPRNPNALICRFGAIDTTVYKDRAPPETHEDMNGWQPHEPFEIKFNRLGVWYLIMNSHTGGWHADIVRAIVSQLSIGVSRPNEPNGAYNDTESLYVGKCASLVKIFRAVRNERNPWKESYEIVPTEWFAKARGEVVEIAKTRDPARCTRKRDRMSMDASYDSRITSSQSRIVISDTGFDSFTINIINLRVKGEIVPLYEKIALNLISVLPAEEETLPSVSNPISIGLEGSATPFL